MLLGSPRTDPARLAAIHEIKGWTRARFLLDEDAAVMVSEIRCPLPGCPPLETIVAFWTGSERRHAFKVFKPLQSVGEADLPPRFMRDALLDTGENGECC